MSDNSPITTKGKISFGCDFLNIMRGMELPDEKEHYEIEKESVVDSVARFFLLQWDFSVEEIDEANKVFWDKVASNQLDEKITTVFDRIVMFLKDDKIAQDKFFVQLTAVAQMDQTFLNREDWYIKYFQEKFDIRPSELQQFYKKGWDWRIALDAVGQQYTEYNNKKPKEPNSQINP